jgi:hypothetical protein
LTILGFSVGREWRHNGVNEFTNCLLSIIYSFGRIALLTLGFPLLDAYAWKGKRKHLEKSFAHCELNFMAFAPQSLSLLFHRLSPVEEAWEGGTL